MVSSDFGKLEVQRHFSSGIDCAMAGMATPVAAVAMPVSPAALRNSRRFMGLLPRNLELPGDAARYRGGLLSRTAQEWKPSPRLEGAPFPPCHLTTAAIHWRRRQARRGDPEFSGTEQN